MCNINNTNRSIGRDSSRDSDSHSSTRGVLGVPMWFICITNFTGDNIKGLLSETLSSSTTFRFVFPASSTATLFLPRSVQDLAAEPLLHRSCAKAPGFKYFTPEPFDRLLRFNFFGSLSFVNTFPIPSLTFPQFTATTNAFFYYSNKSSTSIIKTNPSTKPATQNSNASDFINHQRNWKMISWAFKNGWKRKNPPQKNAENQP